MVTYLKISLKNIGIFSTLSKGEINLLGELILRVKTSNELRGLILLNVSVRKEISDALGFKIQTFNNMLNSLCKKNVLLRKDTNMYFVNEEIILLE